MDATKYKSVAIKVAVYNKARPMADKDYCTMGGFISKLIEDEYNYRKSEKKNGSQKQSRITKTPNQCVIVHEI